MSLLTKPVRLGASVAATALEITASQLRRLSERSQDDEPRAAAPSKAAEKPVAVKPVPEAAASKPDPEPRPEASTAQEHGTKPAPATRTRIANPKAARKVRSRER